MEKTASAFAALENGLRLPLSHRPDGGYETI